MAKNEHGKTLKRYAVWQENLWILDLFKYVTMYGWSTKENLINHQAIMNALSASIWEEKNMKSFVFPDV